MINWLKSLFKPTCQDEWLSKEYDKYNEQFEAFYNKLVELSSTSEPKYGRMEFDIGSFKWSGGWLIASYYFDVYPIKQTRHSRYMGRIYIGRDIIGGKCRLNIHSCDAKHKVKQEKIFFEEVLKKEHLQEAIQLITNQ